MSQEIYNKIVLKLEKLDKYLGYLSELQQVNKEVFTADYHFFGLAERYFQLSIEVMLDVGKMLLLSEKTRRPEDNSDIFYALSEAGVISRDFVDRISGVVNFRNILVHEYEDIDKEIIYTKLQKNLEDFTEFKRQVIKYLSK